ncbi:MAG: DUF2294 domain-containing protein [Actinomycetota bacterium]|nr:DUF2294 domain-containing protein [Actinomycetota bacterium]
MAEASTDWSMRAAVSNALVGLHKQQFGRGPTKARTDFAGPDVLVTVLQNALLPAEKALAEMGEHIRVMEARAFFEEATRDQFIRTIEEIVRRKIYSFHSTCDPRTGIVIEIAVFEPPDSDGGADGNGAGSTQSQAAPEETG